MPLSESAASTSLSASAPLINSTGAGAAAGRDGCFRAGFGVASVSASAFTAVLRVGFSASPSAVIGLAPSLAVFTIVAYAVPGWMRAICAFTFLPTSRAAPAMTTSYPSSFATAACESCRPTSTGWSSTVAPSANGASGAIVSTLPCWSTTK